jgi:hypothetical protein
MNFNFNFKDKIDKMWEYKDVYIPKNLKKSHIKIIFFDDGDYEIFLAFTDSAYLFKDLYLKYVIHYELFKDKYTFIMGRNFHAEYFTLIESKTIFQIVNA